jgi:H+/Cl- antiporter ClcA
MKNKVLSFFILVGVFVGSAPVAIILTFLLVPFWSWLEAASDIESIGHSGPAEWCYLLVYTLVVLACSLIWYIKRKKSRMPPRVY